MLKNNIADELPKYLEIAGQIAERKKSADDLVEKLGSDRLSMLFRPG